MAKATFEESQRFSRWWLMALLGGWIFGVVLLFNDPTVEQLGGLGVVVVVLGGVSLLFMRMRLLTRIDGYGVHYRFTGFMRWKQVSWSEIDKAELRTYNALGEFGGWGYRRGWFNRGMAYTVGGDKGIQLYLLNGKKLLLGTHEPEAAAAALERFGGKRT